MNWLLIGILLNKHAGNKSRHYQPMTMSDVLIGLIVSAVFFALVYLVIFLLGIS